MTLAYRTRPATAADVDFLVEVVITATRDQGRLAADFDKQSWRRDYARWTAHQIRTNQTENTTSVIEVDGRAVGRLRVLRSEEFIELAGIQLYPDMQGRGIGSAVVEVLKTEASNAGIPLRISVEKDNPRARQLYVRLGLLQLGQSGGEYQLQWVP